MKKLITIILLFITTLTFSQIRLTEKIEYNTSEKIKFGFELEDRIDNRLEYEHFDFGMSYKLSNRFALKLNSRIVHEFDSGLVENEFRPHLSVEYKHGKFGMRKRFELRFKDDELAYRFRNKYFFTQKIRGKFNLYIAEEMFVAHTFNENRIYTGILLKDKPLNVLVYYLFNSKKKDDWTHQNIIGVSTRFSF